MKIDVNGVSITLTQDQLAEIARQTSKIKTYQDIKSFEIACEHQNIDVCLFNSKLSGLTKSEIALRKLKIIVKAIRSFTNWTPDFNNSNQEKWFVYFNAKCGFSYWRTTYCATSTPVPSALYTENSKQAEFLGTTHLDLFKDYLLED